MRSRSLIAGVVVLAAVAGSCASADSSDTNDAVADPSADSSEPGDAVADPSVVVADHLAARNAGDLAAQMALYADDAVVIGHALDDDGSAQGVDEIRQLEDWQVDFPGTVTEYFDVEVSGDTVTFDHRFFADDGECFGKVGNEMTVVDGKITRYDWGVDEPSICPAVEIDDTVEAGVVEMYLPGSPSTSASSSAPLIVLIPGGGWRTADPTGLIPLAESLAEQGAIVATTTYRASSNGVFFPETVQDVACTIAQAAAGAGEAGVDYGDIVVVGHSAGAHLGALVTLRPGEFDSNCSAPAVAIDRFVGLAGPYDVTENEDGASKLFGPDNTEPDSWSPGNPMAHATNEPQIDVLLVHGASDKTVAIRFTESFAAALEDGSHDVTTSYPTFVDHETVFSSEIAAPLIAAWLNL
jgi:acetyl esterase/lipase